MFGALDLLTLYQAGTELNAAGRGLAGWLATEKVMFVKMRDNEGETWRGWGVVAVKWDVSVHTITTHISSWRLQSSVFSVAATDPLIIPHCGASDPLTALDLSPQSVS